LSQNRFPIIAMESAWSFLDSPLIASSNLRRAWAKHPTILAAL